ncbi:MAG: thioredoxin domain-containing protein [Planctomycetota bacterium]|nr:MAG: thioredoxin domain-containing protein [Planctomycetota bacterium]
MGETTRQEASSSRPPARPPNRLAREKSPYLLQHAHNPVDWYPWGEEAFARARHEDKPIFLSVGYATCHWCHVMERESFEDEEIARLLNEHFVCVKVDREERPDVDRLYMEAVQATTGQGGWPMSVFLTPEGKPFFCGTYFPPADRWGRPGFATVLRRIAELWRTRREELERGAAELTAALQQAARASTAAPTPLGPEVLDRLYQQLERSFDRAHGGFGRAPKFPRPHLLGFLLRYRTRALAPAALPMVKTTLDAMARGGIHDQLGGGFHRYSTDERWLVPHFEKMLYDQALLARAYLEAYQVTGAERHAEVARGIFTYVLRDLASPEGAFYCGEDADSEGVEGRFYVWTCAELAEILGPEDGALFAEAYGCRPEGNYREEASGERTGANILHLPRPLEEIARARGLEPPELAGRLGAMRARLLQARARRVHPLRDDKVLLDWNGLMIGALAFGARVLGEPRWAEAARRAAQFCLEQLRRPQDGRWLHRWREGEAAVPAFLDDHAFLLEGLLDLYEATFEVRWLEQARALAESMIELFSDEARGGFRLCGRDAEPLLAEVRDAYDGAVPSGNSAAAVGLLRLARLLGEPRYEEVAVRTVQAFSALAARHPEGFPYLLTALWLALAPGRQIVLAGPEGAPELEAMRRLLGRSFLPDAVVLRRPAEPAAARRLAELVPSVAAQGPVEGRPTAYVCVGQTCRQPVHTAAALAEELRRS